MKLMLSIARSHRNRLKQGGSTNPDIDALYQLYLPAYNDFYNLAVSAGVNFGKYRGSTSAFEKLVKELSSYRIRKWDIAIQDVYIDEPNEYLKILSKGRRPFQRGAYEERISAIKSLVMSLQDRPNLSHVLSNVQSFLTQIEAARTKQQGIEGQKKELRSKLEHARERLAVVMYRILGQLMYLYPESPSTIESYYELHYFRASRPSAAVAGSRLVAANSSSKALGGIFTNSNQIVIDNTGNTPLGFFITNNQTAPIPQNLTRLQPKTTQTFTLQELTDGNKPLVLMVVNLTAKNGRYRVTVSTLPTPSA